MSPQAERELDEEHERKLGTAIAEWLELRQAGRAPSIESFAREHAPLDADVRACLHLLDSGAPGPRGMSPLPATFGEFQIVREIGRGGMGVVYEALQTTLPRRVALKMMWCDDAERSRRFQLEIEATARLAHPGIVAIHQAGRTGEVAWYTMPMLDGSSLDRWLGDEARRSSMALARGCGRTAEWVERFVGAAEALQHAHERGVLHRDVKPSNLFLTNDGRLLVLDFGLTRSNRVEDQSATDALVGTPRYMSPEQILGQRERVDGRTDVFSLGATLYEVFARAPAFEGETRDEVYRSILAHDPPALRSLDPRFPRDLDTVIGKALEKDPERRYADAAAFAADLRRFLDHQPVLARPLGPLGRCARAARRHPAAAVALACGMIGACAAMVAIQASAHARANTVERLLDEADLALGLAQAGDALDRVTRALALDATDARARGLFALAEERLERQHARERVDEARRRAGEFLERVRAARRGTNELARRMDELRTFTRGQRLESPSWLPLAARGALLEAERELTDARARREADLGAMVGWLLSALEFAPGESAVRGELAALAYHELQRAERARDPAEARRWFSFCSAYDDGTYAHVLEGTGSLAVETCPPGAEVHLFRYEERDGRLVPLPFDPLTRTTVESAEVGAARGPWVRFEVEAVEELDDVSELRAGDEIQLVCGMLPLDPDRTVAHFLENHEHVVLRARSGTVREVRIPAGSPRSLRGRSEVRPALTFPRIETNSLGTTPVAPVPLPMGRYLVWIEGAGSAVARVSLGVDRSEDEDVCVDLWSEARLGSNFAFVPAGRAIVGGDARALTAFEESEPFLAAYGMQEREVTFREYFEFLRDIDRRDSQGAEARGPRQGVAGHAVERLWKRDARGRLAPNAPIQSEECPVVGVSADDAAAYARWRDEQDADPAMEYDLPTELEWEKAARGGDGRFLPWGDAFDWTFCSGKLSAWRVEPLPVGSYATDESPYGIRDLGGSVREWCRSEPRKLESVLRGGAWGLGIEANFRSANRSDQRPRDWVDTNSGFRLVKRLRRDLLAR